MNIPINRVVAFAGPAIAAISTAVAAFLVAKVNVLGIPGLDQANTATYLAAGITAALVAGLHALGGLAWFKGHHILLTQTAPEGPGDTDALPRVPVTEAPAVDTGTATP